MVQLTPQHPYVTVRLKFKKVGSLQYISHLDLVRTMSKIITRAKLPLWYTEGFNPKPKMIFAAPLSIGTESVCEFMDLRLIDDMPAEEVKARLNANMTDEMQVLAAYYPETKPTDLKWFSYELSIDTVGADDVLAQRINSALSNDRIEVIKKSKKGEVTADIKPLIKTATATFADGVIRLFCILSADSSSFLNPEYLIKYLKVECGILSSEALLTEGYSVMRISAYREDMSEFL